MTDLSKGIIEIEGFEIHSSTMSAELNNRLGVLCHQHAVSKSGKVEIFIFKKVNILNRCFDADVTFIRQRLSEITLYSYYDNDLSYEGRFQADCEWLKNLLGEPMSVSDEDNTYYYDGLRIYSFIQRDLSRNPAETFICCKYGG